MSAEREALQINSAVIADGRMPQSPAGASVLCQQPSEQMQQDQLTQVASAQATPACQERCTSRVLVSWKEEFVPALVAQSDTRRSHSEQGSPFDIGPRWEQS